MIAERLRKSILQAAIQGKLTEQLPEDGDARDLLAAIQAAKAQLIKDRKIKKEEVLPEITEDEIPFDIPENWCWARLGKVAIGITDGTHSTPQYTSSGIPFLSVKDMSSGYLDFSNTRFVSQETHNGLKKRCYPKRNDLLITKVGTTGVPVIVDTDIEFSLFVSVALIKYPVEYISPGYLKLILNSPFVQQQVDENTRGVGNKNWVIRDISNTLIVLPPLREQVRIVDNVVQLMTKIDALRIDETKLNTLQKSFPKKMKDSLLQSAIQGKLTKQMGSDGDAHDLVAEIQKEKASLIKEKKMKKEKELPEITEDEIPFDIPDNWCWVRLGNVAQVLGGYAFKSTDFSNIGCRVIRISDFNEYGFIDNKIVRHEYNKKFDGYLIKTKDIIMCMTGGTVGKTLLVEKILEKMMLNQRVADIRSLEINYRYLYAVISASMIKEIINIRKNSTNDNISMKDINEFYIPLPPLPEQHRIVECLDQLLPLCDALE